MAFYLTIVETKELVSDAMIIPCSNPPGRSNKCIHISYCFKVYYIIIFNRNCYLEYCEADGDCEHIKGFCGFFQLWSDTKLCYCPPPTFENNHVEDVLLSLTQDYYPVTEPVPIIVLCNPKSKIYLFLIEF